MLEPIWVDRVLVDAIHYDQLQQHGGHPGLKDENALESALARPRNKLNYAPDSDLATLAAAYAFGWDLIAAETEVVAVMFALAAGEMSEAEFAEWIRSNVTESDSAPHTTPPKTK